MHTEEDYEIVEAMEKFGGSFVQSLAQCFRHADPVNYAKLRITFPEYWEEYKKLSENI